jgi:quercetin dioxygenase-like cupin family protein
MNRQEFEMQLAADGYTNLEVKISQARPANEHHGHAFGARGMVLAGTFTVSRRGSSKTYRVGEVFAVAPEQEHSEEIGPEGAEIVVGRKY